MSKVITLKHHPFLNTVNVENPFYANQVPDDLKDYTVVNVTSRVERDKNFMKEHPDFARELSPFFIGPVETPDGATAHIFEIFWQCSKVYPCHDNNGTPTADYFKWRNEFFSKTTCTKDLMRHASHSLGYENKDCRYFLYYNKDKGKYENLTWVEARKKVYIPYYARLVYNTPSFKWLKSLVDSGEKVALVDFDGYNYSYSGALEQKYRFYLNRCKKNKITPTITKDDYLNLNDIKKVINCPTESVGHGFVIEMLLNGVISVNKDGTISDPDGVLE